MVLARVAEYFSPSTSPTPQPFVGGEPADRLPGFKHGVGREQVTPVMEDIEEEEEPRPEYVHVRTQCSKPRVILTLPRPC